MKDLRELIENNSELYGCVYEAKELYTDKQYISIVNDLYKQYSADYKLLSTENDVEAKKDLFDANFNHAAYVPRKWFIFSNKIGKLRYRELLLAFNKFYDDRLDNYLSEFNVYECERIKKSLARKAAANAMRKECQALKKAAIQAAREAKRAAKAERKAAHQNAKAEKKAAKKAKNIKK